MMFVTVSGLWLAGESMMMNCFLEWITTNNSSKHILDLHETLCRIILPIGRTYFSSSCNHVVSNGDKFWSDKRTEPESHIYASEVFLIRRSRYKFSKDCLDMPKRVNKRNQTSLRRIQEHGGAAEDNFRRNGSTTKTRKRRILPVITWLKWKISCFLNR